MSTTRPRQPGFDYAVSDEMLRQMVDIIVREIDPEQIILFGSRARGDSRPDSDIDLVIIEKEPYGKDRSRRLRAGALYRALMGFPPPTDLLLFSEEEVEYWRNSLNSVVARALHEGRVLYARH